MTDREFFIKTVEDESPRFDRVFKALPQERADYRPDPKSKTTGELVPYIATEASAIVEILDFGKTDMAKLKPVSTATIAEAGEEFIKFLENAKDLAKKISESDWNSPAQMLAGSHVEWETTKGQMAWSLLLDFIHHRGQLSTYIRPMGGKVPNIYGPSADTK